MKCSACSADDGRIAKFETVPVTAANFLRPIDVPRNNVAGRRDAAFQFGGTAGRVYSGISWHPWSHFRAASVWFDQDPQPIALVGRAVIQRCFRVAFIEPLAEATRVGAQNITTTSGFSATPLCPQRGLLRLWYDGVPDYEEPLSAGVQFAQKILTGAAVTPATGDRYMFIHAPGTTVVTVGAHNNDSANQADIVLTGEGTIPEVTLDAPPRSAIVLAPDSANKTLLAAASLVGCRLEFDPTVNEWLVFYAGAPLALGSYTIALSAQILFAPGWF